MPGNVTIVDEAMIDASPDTVFNAVLDEFTGVSHWWMPHFEIKPRADTPVRRTGMISDVTIHGAGTIRFSWTVTMIAEGKSMGVEYNGDFTGTGEWVFEPVDGKKKVKYIWTGRPKRLLLVLALSFMDIKKVHSEAIQRGFKGLNDYIIKKQVSTGTLCVYGNGA
jgi:uncharacterized protein YndB with AHSA1/START domain